jgi:alpha-galactosidase
MRSAIVEPMKPFAVWIAVSGLSSMLAATAQQPTVAATPPMGWNSWDAYGLTITEPQFHANVDVLRDKLLPFGWNYAVIDEGWFFENPADRPTPAKLHYAIDPHGRYVPVPARFPSAVVSGAAAPLASPADATHKLSATIESTSFTALGAWVHAQSLKFGIHIVRGIPRAAVERNLPIEGSSFHAQDAADTTDACPWDPTNWGVRDNAAGQAWYDSLLRQYASWGVDLLKVDCIADHPFKLDEIEMIHRAIEKTGRPIVLSLSPGPTALAHAADVARLSNMWRISDDHWDLWAASPASTFPQGTRDQFARLAAWAPYAKPGNWPDADMLPLGQLSPAPGEGKARASRLTPDEQRTELTLWSIARSPLILGANLTQLDAATLALLTNRNLIAINQTATKSVELLHHNDFIVWQANLSNHKIALALFNIGNSPMHLNRAFGELSPTLGKQPWNVRDVWAGKDLGQEPGVTTDLPPHSSLLLLLHP